jgi:hypothetical protein
MGMTSDGEKPLILIFAGFRGHKRLESPLSISHTKKGIPFGKYISELALA